MEVTVQESEHDVGRDFHSEVDEHFQPEHIVWNALRASDAMHNEAMDNSHGESVASDNTETMSSSSVGTPLVSPGRSAHPPVPTGGMEQCTRSYGANASQSMVGGALDGEDNELVDSSAHSGSDSSGESTTNASEFTDYDDDEPMDMGAEWESVDEAGRIPLFHGSSLSMLACVLILLNICRMHRVSNAFINELLHVLSRSILPSPNSLPDSERKASRLLHKLGLGYKAIHACSRGCVLFRGAWEHAETCPKCGECRFKRVGKSTVPRSVLRHFPLVNRLKRMFSTPALSKLMTWHKTNMSTDGKM